MRPWHPVHLRFVIEVEEILAGSIGKKVEESFLGVGRLENDRSPRMKQKRGRVCQHLPSQVPQLPKWVVGEPD